MAIREVGKALGLTDDITAALADTVWGSWGDELPDEQIRQAGLDPANPAIRQAVDLANELIGFPRHLSQHVGGFVLTQRPLDETVPIGNAAMADRTFIEWDKDDIDALGLMKVDVLALGMLSCIRRGLDFLQQPLRHRDFPTVADIPQDDAAVYDMLSKADFGRRLPGREPGADVDAAAAEAEGVLRPRDRGRDRAPGADPGRHGASLPAPAQGRSRQLPLAAPDHGRRTSSRTVLEKTFGVPLFQEQAMRIAIVAAKFTPRRGRRAAPRHGDLQELRQHRRFPRQVHRRHDAPRLPARLRRALLQADRGLRLPTASPRATRPASRSSSTPRPG